MLVAIVPVRAGSRGLKNKNLRPLAGVPLWERAVRQGLQAGADHVVVSTDIEELLTQDMEGVTFLRRPEALAGDNVPMAPALIHALEEAVPDNARVVLLQATSPLRDVDDIQSALRLFDRGTFDLVKTVTPTASSILKYGTMDDGRFVPVSDPAYCFANRQSLPEVMRPNGAVYVFEREWFLANGGFETGSIGAVVMPEERSHDIDSEEDFQRAEALLSEGS